MQFANEAEKKLMRLRENICRYRERIEEITALLTKTNVTFVQDKIQVSPNRNQMLDGIGRIVDLGNRLIACIEGGVEFIGQLNSEQLQEICVLYYVERREVCDIAEQMKYSVRHVYRLLSDATGQLSEFI